MISKLLTSIFGSSNDRTLKRLRKRVAQINKRTNLRAII